jgi:hypothetical protein
MPAEILDRNVTFNQMGTVICGSTNEVRALVLGRLAFERQPTDYRSIHESLRDLNYDKFHIFKPKEHVLRTATRTPDEIVEVNDGDIDLSDELGQHAVAFSGVLFEHLPRTSNIGFSKLTGTFKETEGAAAPSTTIRRVVLNILAHRKSVKRSELVNTSSEITGCYNGMIRSHVAFLVRTGIVTLDENALLSVRSEYKEPVCAYTDLASDFQTDETLRKQGYDYMTSLVSGEHKDSKLIPYFSKRSVVQSGRSKAPAVDELVQQIRNIFGDYEQLYTNEVASRLGMETPIVAELLQRMERTSYKNPPIVRINQPNTGRTKVFERLWARPTTNSGS